MIQDICSNSAGGSTGLPDPFQKLCDRHKPQLKRLASRAAQAPFSAEELLREGQYALWLATQKFRGDPFEDADGFAGYVERVVQNHLNRLKGHFFRRELARQEIERQAERAGESITPLEADDELTCRVQTALAYPESDLMSPTVIILKREAATELRRAISLLNQRQRAVIEYRFFSHATLAETGHHLGLTPQAVCVYESRALARLRGMIEPTLAETIHQGRN